MLDDHSVLECTYRAPDVYKHLYIEAHVKNPLCLEVLVVYTLS